MRASANLLSISLTICSIIEGVAFSTILYISFEPSLVRILAITSPSLNCITMLRFISSDTKLAFLLAGIKSFAFVLKNAYSVGIPFDKLKDSGLVALLKFA